MKKNNIFTVFLLTLLFFAIGSFGYVMYNKFMIKENKNNDILIEENNEIKEIVKDLSLDDEIVKDLSSKVIGVYTNHVGKNYNDYFYQNDLTDIETESLNFKLSLAAEAINDELFKTITEGYNCSNRICGISYIEEDKIKNAYYELYGENSTYERANFEVNTCKDTYKWSDTNNRYEAIIPDGCGGTSFGGTMSKLGYAKKVIKGNNEKIELYEYFAYEKPSFDSDIVKYYSDYKRENLIFSTAELLKHDEFFNKYSDKVGIYKYTFEKDKNNKYNKYIFKTVEKIK